MKKLIKENGYLLGLWFLCIVASIFFVGHYANILSDVGREVYYPARILDGKILYKDLFVIYGPLAYQWNAVLYKIFGANLKVLYTSGIICSFGIISAVYLIAKRFLSDFLSFGIGVFAITTGICATHLFNFTFPYSWAMLYGTFLSLYSLLCLIKYKDRDNVKWLYAATLLSGCAAACKYDFILYSLIVLGVVVLTKNIKVILKSLLFYLIIPVLSFGILFLQGLSISDLVESSQVLKSMVGTKSLEYFYKHSGVYFSIPILIYWIINAVKATIGFTLIYTGMIYTKKKLEVGIILLIVGVLTTFFVSNPAIFSFLIGLTIILTIIQFKKIKEVKLLSLLILSAVALSLKSLWGLTPLNYGNYYCATVLIAFFALLFSFLKNKNQTAAGIFVLVVSLWFFMFNVKTLTSLNYKIETAHGKIYTTEFQGKPISALIEFLNLNATSVNATIFPEGLLINFLSKSAFQSDDYYNSLLPLYVETFGEKKIIQNFTANSPDYVIFDNQSMSDYNSGYICQDYAIEFCKFIQKNYRPVASIGTNFGFYVFQKNI